MGLYSPPPPVLAFADVKPTLLVCWWITVFCLTIILLRIAGRFIRSERLFVEDRTVAWAIIPLFLRMGCVHVILIYGTNNVDFDGVAPSHEILRRRAIGSGLVLASRIFHAATLWILKIAVLEFFRRISDAMSERFSQVALVVIRYVLAATFVAIIISDLAECHPFRHYWQVFPDPGGQCRQGYAQLLTLTVCNVFTDLLLVLFPIPIIFFSHQTVKRKIQLILLFSLSLGVVGASLYRVARVIDEHGSQQLRSLLASVELLFATAAANSLVLGSFVRDRGVKKKKFRAGSMVDSMERSSIARSRRPTANRHWGSDEDLVRDLGLGVQPELRSAPGPFLGGNALFSGPLVDTTAARPSSVLKTGHMYGGGGANAESCEEGSSSSHSGGDVHHDDDGDGGDGHHGHAGMAHMADMHTWQFPDRRRSGAANSSQSAQSAQSGLSSITGHGQGDDEVLLGRDALIPATRTNSTSTPRKVSFYDVGDLLGGDNESETDKHSVGPSLRSPGSGAGTRLSSDSVPPSPVFPASSRGFRRGSATLLQDLGGLLGPPTTRTRQKSDARSSTLQTVPQGTAVQSMSPLTSTLSSTSHSSRYSPQDIDGIDLQDPGGLLSRGKIYR